MNIVTSILFVASFFAIWFGAGVIISAIGNISQKFHITPFTVSFFVLGLLTSIPEFAVGFTAIATHNPQIFVGNLLGGIPVLFLFAIPLLAIFGNGITLSHKLSRETLFLILTIIAIPAAFALDQHIGILEACVLIFLYTLLFFFIEHQQPTMHIHPRLEKIPVPWHFPIHAFQLLFGVLLVFVSSQIIVTHTIALATYFHISPFLVSLIIVSLGTNLPELSVGLRSVFSGKNDIALGDYLGSATANVIILGLMTLINRGEVITASSFTTVFLFIMAGTGLFYIFSKSKKGITRGEGFFLLSLYVLFVLLEIIF